MGKYDSKLLGNEEIAQSTLAFHFEKPAGFAFTPGQSINLFLPEGFPGVSDDRQRAFSLVSAARGPADDRDPHAQECLQAAAQGRRARRGGADRGPY